MKRIDLHIHTKSTPWDEPFDFDVEQLAKHVVDWDLDAIAITNHNEFDYEQYNEIEKLLKGRCTVLPGVEASVMGTHLLLVCDPSLAKQLPSMCEALSSCLTDVRDSATLDELIEAFPLLDRFIVIPHYRKSPSITKEGLSALGGYACALETSSAKGALRLNKLGGLPLPVRLLHGLPLRVRGHGGKPPEVQAKLDLYQSGQLLVCRHPGRAQERRRLAFRGRLRVPRALPGRHLYRGRQPCLGQKVGGQDAHPRPRALALRRG